MRDSESLDAFAGAVVDGEAVDVPTSLSAGDDEGALLEELRIIGDICRLHRESRDPLAPLATEIQSRAATPSLFSWGSLRVIAPLGSGTFGEVFRAWDTSLDREVALKLLRSAPPTGVDGSDAVVREGRLLARIRHPNVMAVYGAATIESRVGIWGELLHGRTLEDIVAFSGPLSAQEAGLIVDAVCRALTAVHRGGLLHRDVKAQNVMREPGGRIVLMDFGVGRETAEPLAPGRELAGTPLYLAPELFRGKPASVQSDIYSVGVLLFYLVTGRLPVEGGSIDQLTQRHLQGRRTRLQDLRPNLPAAFARVVDGALAPDPSDRYASAGALQSALSTATQLTGIVDADTERPRRGAFLAGLAVAALVIGIGALVAWYRFSDVEMLDLTLSASPGLTFTEGSRNVPAVSPDGRSVAFLATDTKGIVQLWVRTFANPAPHLMPGSDDATRPFWSPDGKSLAYFAKQGLWRVDISGARPELLARGNESRGGSWSPDGVLILALDPNRGLESMAATANAERRVVTTVNHQRNENQHMWPQFLPDGRHFIFFVLSGDENIEGVYLGSLEGGAPKQLVKSHTSAVFAGGRLFYTTNGGLFVQSLDTAAGALVGAAEPAAVPVDATVDQLLMLSVADNGTALYVRPELRQLTWYDFAGRELGVVATPDRFKNPVLSPDGRSLVVERHRLGISELLAFDLTRDVPPETLSAPSRPTCPVWNSDGSLTFSASPQLFRDLYTLPPGPNASWTLLVQSLHDKEPTSWSTDGRRLAYTSYEVTNGARQADIWTTSLPDSRKTPFLNSEAMEVSGVYSPRGGWMAYVAKEAKQDPYVFIRGLTNGRIYKVSGGGVDPSWHSENELLYLDNAGTLWSVKIPADAGAPLETTILFKTPITTPRTSRNNYTVAVGGTRLLFNRVAPSSGPTTFSVIMHWKALK